MSESTIRYNENEFLIYDVFTQLLCQYLCKTMEDKGVHTYSENMQSIYEEFKLIKEGWVLIDVDLYLDIYILTPQDVTDVLEVLDETKAYLATLGEEISIEILNAQEVAHKTQIDEIFNWHTPLKPQSLINFCNLIIDLLTMEKFDKKGLYTFVGFEQDSPKIRAI